MSEVIRRSADRSSGPVRGGMFSRLVPAFVRVAAGRLADRVDRHEADAYTVAFDDHRTAGLRKIAPRSDGVDLGLGRSGPKSGAALGRHSHRHGC